MPGWKECPHWDTLCTDGPLSPGAQAPRNTLSKRREDAGQALGRGGHFQASCPLDLPSMGMGPGHSLPDVGTHSQTHGEARCGGSVRCGQNETFACSVPIAGSSSARGDSGDGRHGDGPEPVARILGGSGQRPCPLGLAGLYTRKARPWGHSPRWHMKQAPFRAFSVLTQQVLTRAPRGRYSSIANPICKSQIQETRKA